MQNFVSHFITIACFKLNNPRVVVCNALRFPSKGLPNFSLHGRYSSFKWEMQVAFKAATFQEGQRVVAVRVNVAVVRISCDDAPTSTSNSPASATHWCVRSS